MGRKKYTQICLSDIITTKIYQFEKQEDFMSTVEIKNKYGALFDIIKSSLWGFSGQLEVDNKTFEEMEAHCILALPAAELSQMLLSEELRERWKCEVFRTVAFYTRYIHEQSALPIDVPYVILKGTSAAQYYPHPELREMGDIDIMVKREDFLKACSSLIENGYQEMPRRQDSGYIRHREFFKNGVLIEVHLYFAEFNNTFQSEYFDDLILKNINDSHLLPDLVNGLVLLEHINQHLEEGLGLRQIIDWMMFVERKLTDEKWKDFQIMAQKTGLEKLALVTTHMCEMYLGLSTRLWCATADPDLCSKMMDYILCCGNFGTKISNNKTGINVLSLIGSPLATLKLFQERGLVNWKAAHNHMIIRPFAWLYQIGRYLRRGFARNNAARQINEEYAFAKRRNYLLNSLGVKRYSKRVVIYKDGQYKKWN